MHSLSHSQFSFSSEFNSKSSKSGNILPNNANTQHPFSVTSENNIEAQSNFNSDQMIYSPRVERALMEADKDSSFMKNFSFSRGFTGIEDNLLSEEEKLQNLMQIFKQTPQYSGYDINLLEHLQSESMNKSRSSSRCETSNDKDKDSLINREEPKQEEEQDFRLTEEKTKTKTRKTKNKEKLDNQRKIRKEKEALINRILIDNYHKLQESSLKLTTTDENLNFKQCFGDKDRYSRRKRFPKLNHVFGERIVYEYRGGSLLDTLILVNDKNAIKKNLVFLKNKLKKINEKIGRVNIQPIQDMNGQNLTNNNISKISADLTEVTELADLEDISEYLPESKDLEISNGSNL